MDHRLWSLSRGVGALTVIVLFAAVVFVPCYVLVDRFPRRWLIRTMQALAVLAVALAAALIIQTAASGEWTRAEVGRAVVGVFVLLAASLAFLRAAAHGAEVKWLRPQGDPVEHWSHVLREAPMWWFRSRAARELASDADDPRARTALQESLSSESNRHVRRAVTDGLGFA